MKARIMWVALVLAFAGMAQAQAISGEPYVAVRGSASQEVTPDLFPLELTRDPASPYLAPEYHDVLTDDPAVLAAVMRDAEAHLSGRS